MTLTNNIKDQGGMGFNDLELFNTALLAKMAWRLNALWAKVLKAVYFPNDIFLKAKKGARAFWMGLLTGREAMMQGAVWQINCGKGIKVWQDVWIPGLKGQKLSLERGVGVNRELEVEDLINWEHRCWDLAALHISITIKEKKAIEGIYIPELKGHDKLVWPHKRNGQISVRSVYALLKEQEIGKMISDPSSSRTIDIRVWKHVRHIDCLPKIKQFLCRCFSNAIAVKENLWKRKIASDGACPFCDSPESVEHALLCCEWCHVAWFSSVGIRVEKEGISSLDRWLLCVMENNDTKGKAREEIKR